VVQYDVALVVFHLWNRFTDKWLMPRPRVPGVISPVGRSGPPHGKAGQRRPLHAAAPAPMPWHRRRHATAPQTDQLARIKRPVASTI
jgi:hypothetical protein